MVVLQRYQLVYSAINLISMALLCILFENILWDEAL